MDLTDILITGIAGAVFLGTVYLVTDCMDNPDPRLDNMPEVREQFQRRSANLREELYGAGVQDSYSSLDR